MANFGKLIIVILIVIIEIIIKGFIIMKLWTWFIVPIFEINQLRIVEAIGIMLLVNYLNFKREKNNRDNDFSEELGTNIGFVIGTGIFILFSGWIIQSLM